MKSGRGVQGQLHPGVETLSGEKEGLAGRREEGGGVLMETEICWSCEVSAAACEQGHCLGRQLYGCHIMRTIWPTPGEGEVHSFLVKLLWSFVHWLGLWCGNVQA